MTHRAIVLAILMLAPLPAQAQPQPAGLEALKASNAYIDCLMRAARKLDDGHSAVAGVGRSIQNACLEAQHRWENAQSVHFSEARKRVFLEEVKTQSAMVAVNIVLEERRFRRN
jgi:hypothetical protein